MALKDLVAVKGKLSEKQIKKLPSSFDIIGNKEKAVAVVEIPKELSRRKRLIADAIMRQHKNVKAVLEKKSKRKGLYRTRDYNLIQGLKNTEVVHAESGCRFMIDPVKVYFSPREGTERLRIAGKVKKNEVVMVFFAGVGPFPIVIARKSKAKHIIGIEINADAVRYFWKNIKLNKADNVQIVHGDVRNKAEHFYGQCNRVLMPLPEGSSKYLLEAIRCLKKNGVCHYYRFLKESNISREKKRIRKTAERIGRRIKFTGIQKVLPYGPGIWKMRIDFKVC